MKICSRVFRRSSFILLAIGLCAGCERPPKSQENAPYIDPHCVPIILAPPPTIVAPPGRIRGDFLHSRNSAEAIGNIILKDVYGGHYPKSTKGVVAVDKGNSWEIVEMGPIGTYGGGFVFYLDKCNATISRFMNQPD